MDILRNLGIIAGRCNQNLLLNLDEIQTASRTLFSYPLSTRHHRRQLGIDPVAVALADRVILPNR